MSPSDACSDPFFKKGKKVQPAAPSTGVDVVAITPLPHHRPRSKFTLDDLGAQLANYRVIISRGMN